MRTDPTFTQFASPERSSPREIEAQARLLREAPGLTTTLDLMPGHVLILDANRQVVFANKPLRESLGEEGAEAVLGLRIGEVFNCAYSDVNAAGCGTTEFCSQCGGTRAVLASLQGRDTVDHCEILQKTGEALDLKVRAAPLEVQGRRFTVFSVLDESGEKRRRALERLFFHDVLNTAGGLYGYADLLSEVTSPEEESGQFARSIFGLSSSIIDEIRAQKDLAAAESNELVPQPAPVDSLEIVQEIAGSYQGHQVAKGRTVQVAPDSASVALSTDRTLLRRVVGNMTKNALEASTPGQAVTLRCFPCSGGVAFAVHNPKAMPRDVQLQVFKRSFTTKGAGRGLGTYSIKLLTERYLGGQVSFTSDEGEGTTFTVVLPLAPKGSDGN